MTNCCLNQLKAYHFSATTTSVGSIKVHSNRMLCRMVPHGAVQQRMRIAMQRIRNASGVNATLGTSTGAFVFPKSTAVHNVSLTFIVSCIHRSAQVNYCNYNRLQYIIIYSEQVYKLHCIFPAKSTLNSNTLFTQQKTSMLLLNTCM